MVLLLTQIIYRHWAFCKDADLRPLSMRRDYSITVRVNRYNYIPGGYIPIFSLFIKVVRFFDFPLAPAHHIGGLQFKIAFYPHNAQCGCVNFIDIGY
jgi:hypothetical protein